MGPVPRIWDDSRNGHIRPHSPTTILRGRVPADQQQTPESPATHYLLDTPCTQVSGHDASWHTTQHPDGRALRWYRTDPGVRHTRLTVRGRDLTLCFPG
ncbi:hypothetical protein SAMN05216267_106419 [Actinacidiphila rubida]|uniref:Uncharacterized protein n=1 Tax=Actinacidiphila rubida TaxID=310780 RepID=A0A1H8U531_9ACTN|nr:hypothetical protein SAMN05216267_106419 [Actinacidiphila rubida]